MDGSAALPQKTAGGCLFRQQSPVTSRHCLRKVNMDRRGKTMSEIVTAGILVIGDEILSGRTKDKNIGFIAEYLTNIGIDLKEVRVVADEEADIVAALDALRHRYDYVFTTGGIGPTHDDITADSVAKAFGVGIDHHPEVVARFRERWGTQDLNEARLRMARIPDGAELIQSATILAPGFKIGNVIVMAGVPSIMQAMMDIVAPKLKSGVRMLSESVRANAREGDIGGPLAGNRQRPSRHRDRQLSVPGRGQEAEHQSRGPLARSGKARCRDGRGQGNAGGTERHHPTRRPNTQAGARACVDENSGTERAGAGRQGLSGLVGPVSPGLPGADLAAQRRRAVSCHGRDHPRRPGAGGDRCARTRHSRDRYRLHRQLRPYQTGRVCRFSRAFRRKLQNSAAAPARAF